MWQVVVHDLIRARWDGRVVLRVLVVLANRSDTHGDVLDYLKSEKLQWQTV